MPGIKRITLRNFKSFRHLDSFEMRPINILIGANGSGKSNFLSVFDLLWWEKRGDLKSYVAQRAGASRFLFNGPSVSKDMLISAELEKAQAVWTLGFLLRDNNEFSSSAQLMGVDFSEIGGGHDIRETIAYGYELSRLGLPANFQVTHFDNTDRDARVRLEKPDMEDIDYLKKDGSNLAAYLLWLKRNHRDYFSMILSAIQLVAPFILDIDPRPLRDNERFVEFRWRQRGMEDDLFAYHLSDGTLRFICLATLLLQPEPPSLIIIDEPELGLHPYAVSVLGGMIRTASARSQIIIATQSPQLLDGFKPEDIVTAERLNGETVLKRQDKKELKSWLKRYSLGDLWRKNVLGGGP